MPAKNKILSTGLLYPQLIREAESKNFTVDVLSFIETILKDDIDTANEIGTILMQNATVVFTSKNSVEAVAIHLHGYTPQWNIYCINNTTKTLVEEYFDSKLIAGTANNATMLAQLIIDDAPGNEIIFFCGDKRRDELPILLGRNKIEVTEIEVYHSKMIHHIINKSYDGILFFSPSAVESFFNHNKLNKGVILFAIGSTTANEIRKYTRNKIVVNDIPGKEHLFQKMIEYFSNLQGKE